MTFAEFKTLTKTFLTVDATRLGPISAYIDQMIRQAVIDIQSYIEVYRVGHETIFGVDDFVEDGKASRVNLPDQAQPRDAFYVATGYGCKRVPLHQYDWGNRFDMICGNMGGCRHAIAIDPQGKSILVYPRVTDGYQVALFWDGLKLDFADADETPFDEQMAACVAEFVTGKLERRVNKDLSLHDSYIKSYQKARLRLYTDAQDRKRLKDIQESPQQSSEIETCSCDANTTDEIDPSSDSIEFVAFGDFGANNANEMEVANLAKSFEPDFMLWLGDCNYTDGAAETIQANILKYFDGYVPNHVYPAWGNHDLLTALDGQYGKPLLDVFPNIAALNSGKLYYDFIRGNAHFFVINSGNTDEDGKEPDGITSDSDQALWIQEKMEASDAPWKIAVLHRPPYTSDETYTPGSTAMRWPFKDWGAHLVLSGHGHNYERLLVDGLTYLVSGLGGNTKRGFGSAIAGSQFRYNSKYGVLRITANEARLQSVFYDVDGNVVDNITLYK